MAGRKKLGMGLDMLLSSVQSSVRQPGEAADWTRIKGVFAQARAEDEAGNVFEAYHLYRTVADLVGEKGPGAGPKAKSLASQSLNNAAVILYEHGYEDQARSLLQKAVETYPDNLTARDNLKSLLQGG